MIKITLFLTKLYMCDWTQPHKDMPVIRVISGNIYSNVFPPISGFSCRFSFQNKSRSIIFGIILGQSQFEMVKSHQISNKFSYNIIFFLGKIHFYPIQISKNGDVWIANARKPSVSWWRWCPKRTSNDSPWDAANGLEEPKIPRMGWGHPMVWDFLTLFRWVLGVC